MNDKGLFVVFDGEDGAGKTTQIRNIATHLRAAGYSVCTTREPGGSPGAEEIRKIVISGDVDRWDPITELMLVSAARRSHIQKTILPRLTEGTVVLCDRFLPSTYAYQGFGGQIDLNTISSIDGFARDGLMPQLTILFSIPDEIRKARMLARGEVGEERFEKMNSDFQKRVREGYREYPNLVSHLPGIVKTIDVGDEPVETVTSVLLDAFLFPLLRENEHRLHKVF